MIVPAPESRIVLCTIGSREDADRIAQALVQGGLAACVNAVPGLLSTYRWKGQVESAEEVLLIIKTSAAQLDSLEAVLRSLHPYEMPEFLVLQPSAATRDYLAWLLDAVQPIKSAPS